VLLLLIVAGLLRLRSQQLYFKETDSINQLNFGFNGAKFLLLITHIRRMNFTEKSSRKLELP